MLKSANAYEVPMSEDDGITRYKMVWSVSFNI